MALPSMVQGIAILLFVPEFLSSNPLSNIPDSLQ
jgi:hypothetical protein